MSRKTAGRVSFRERERAAGRLHRQLQSEAVAMMRLLLKVAPDSVDHAATAWPLTAFAERAMKDSVLAAAAAAKATDAR